MCLRICAVYNQCQIHNNCVGKWMDGKTDRQMDGCVAHILLVFTQFHNATKEPESSGGDFTRIFSPFLGKQSLRVAAVLLPPKRGDAEKGTPSTPGGRGGGGSSVRSLSPRGSLLPHSYLATLKGCRRRRGPYRGWETLAGHSNTPFAEIGPN